MLVTRKNLPEVITKLSRSDHHGLDTETTGLRPYSGDRLFSLIISVSSGSYYFNFQHYEGIDELWVLDRTETFSRLSPLFKDPLRVWYIHNAKFDMAMLANEGIEIEGTIWDTEVGGRLLYNRYLKYSLDYLGEKIGYKKDDRVKEYIKNNKLYTWYSSPGKAKKKKQPHYDRVPFPLISEYGERDGEIAFKIGEYQKAKLQEFYTIIPENKLSKLIANETALVKTCFRMERIGIKIDREYCQRGFDAENKNALEAAKKFKELSGFEFVDSGKALAEAFTSAGEKYPTTEKGNPSFRQDVLEGFSSSLARLVLEHRSAIKRANTYYANFLYYADEYDRIHPNMRQGGTDTGRFSYSEPNLQNCPKDEPGSMKIRSAFIPTGSDWCLVMIDYDQMEYRLMLDYAGQMDVIEKIMNDGLDVHEATASLMGSTRQAAKTLNFLLLYGGGVEKLAKALGISIEKANQLKYRYFKALPKVKHFSRSVIDRAERRGFIFNQAGRICHFPQMINQKTGRKDRFSYRAPNHLIQGGCADIVRFAMTAIDEFLRGYRSRMLLQVHDELLFEVHKSELDIVPELRRIMERSYKYRNLPLTCGVDHSWNNWGDKLPGIPKN